MAVATYADPGPAALTTLTALTAFAAESRRQHGEHLRAFQARATALDPAAVAQDRPHPHLHDLLAAARLATPTELVAFAALVEQAATDTYLANLTQIDDRNTKALVASVMAMAAQRLAALRVMRSLLDTGAAQFLATPLPLAALPKVPAAVVAAAIPAARHATGPPDLVLASGSGVPR